MDQNTENLNEATEGKNLQSDLFTLSENATHIQPVLPVMQSTEQLSAENSLPEEPTTEGQQSETESAEKEISAEPVVDIPKQTQAPKREIHLHSQSGTTLGAMLSEARNISGLSLNEAAEKTHIRSDYIAGLESDKHEKMPTPVFLRAYVKILVELYNLDQSSKEAVYEHLQELEPVKDVPEKLLENIGKDVQISQEEAKRVRMFCIYGGIILFLLLSLTVTCITAFTIRSRNKAAAIREQQTLSAKPFNSQKLEVLLPPQMPEPVILDVPAPKK